MTPQTIETIRNTLEDAVETRGYELSSTRHVVHDLVKRVGRQSNQSAMRRMQATLTTKQGELDAALKQFKLAETALKEFNATYPKGSET